MADDRAPVIQGWGRVIDYLFGRNAMIGLASFMLFVISTYGTYIGMRDFIVGLSSTPTQGRELVGGLSVTNDMLVVVVVVALSFLMWIALRETFGAQRTWGERLIMAPLYVFLALWSIGFGYGFWWSLIAGEEATRTSMTSLQEDARDAGNAIAARLSAVKVQLDNVVTWSEGQMTREESSGGSCGVASGAGRGPLFNARRSVRDSIASLRDGVVKSWLEPVEVDLARLKQSAEGLTGGTVEERQRAFEAQATELRSRARSIAARSNELGRSTAAEMRSIAAAVTVAPGQPGFACFDPTLAQRLTQAAEQAVQPAELKLRAATFNEGPAGVANAIKNLWENIGSYLWGLLVFVFTFGSVTSTHAASGDPITGRDMIALLATVGIDLGLFALTVLNPPASGPVRRDGLAATQSRLHLPTEQVVRQIRDAIRTATEVAPDVSIHWVRRHLVHHNSRSYFIIPNLYRCSRDPKEEMRALAMNQLAGVLSDLKLVTALTVPELKKFGEDELRYSYSDLTPYRDEKTRPLADQPRGWWQRTFGGDRIPAGLEIENRQRNHGLLSKAQRALDIAEWSEEAQKDVEIFRLVEEDGLTPLLAVFHGVPVATREEPAAGGGERTPEPAKPAAV